MQKGFVTPLIIVGVVVLAIVAAGAFYLGKATTFQEVPNPLSIFQSIQPIPSSTTDGTANWKTYTNTLLGYELKYPSSLRLIEKTSFRSMTLTDMELDESTTYPLTGENVLVESVGGQAGSTPAIYKGFLLSIRPNTSSYYSYETLSSYWDKVPIDGLSAYKTEDSFESGGHKAQFINVVLEDSYKDQYELNASFNAANKQEYFSLFNQILSTFRFFDQDQTATEFPPLYPKVDWRETTYQEKYSFANQTMVGGIIEKGADVTVSRLYKDFPEDLVEDFSNYYQQWFALRGWRLVSGGTNLKRYRLGSYNYYRRGHHFKFELSAAQIEKWIGQSDFRFYVAHD